MRALLSVTDDALCASDFFGAPVGLRAAWALVDAGATQIDVCGEAIASSADLPAWCRDPRLAVEVCVAHQPAGAELLLRAEALVSAALLRELPPGRALLAPDGTRVCVRSGELASDDLALQLMAAPAHAFAVDAERFASSLRTADGRAHAERALLRSLHKPSDGPASRHLNRPVSRAITRALWPLGVTPNQMTLAVLAVGLAGAWLASFASFAAQLAGAALFQLHSILDGCDGELARLTRRFGKHGALLDSCVDDLVNVAFFAGLSIGVARALDASWPVHAAMLTTLAYAGTMALQYGVSLRASARGDKSIFWTDAADAPPAPGPFALGKALLRRDVFVWLILIAVALGFASTAVALFPFAALAALASSVLRVRALSARPPHASTASRHRSP